MCGLAGTLLGENLTPGQLARVREIFTKNLLANEIRGPRATGMVVCQEDGSVHVLKKAIPASRFVMLPAFQDFLDNHITAQTRILLGHTREPTKGSVCDHHNNHPITVGDTIGVHNGVITNDDAIFRNLSRQEGARERIGSVDSEAIFALFNEVDPDLPLAPYVTEIASRVRRLYGSFTTLFFNRNKPGKLFCLRYNNPISSHFEEELQSLFFSSRYIFLRKTFGRTVISAPMPGQTGFVFDAREIAARKKEPLCTFPLQQEEAICLLDPKSVCEAVSYPDLRP